MINAVKLLFMIILVLVPLVASGAMYQGGRTYYYINDETYWGATQLPLEFNLGETINIRAEYIEYIKKDFKGEAVIESEGNRVMPLDDEIEITLNVVGDNYIFLECYEEYCPGDLTPNIPRNKPIRLRVLPGTIDNNLANSLKGKILLQVESNGEAWYVNPDDSKRYYLGTPDESFIIMRELGLGITDADIDMIPISQGQSGNEELINRMKGKILLQVESNGEAWYVNPNDGVRYYMGRPDDAYNIMRQFGMGIANDNLNKVPIHEDYHNQNKNYVNEEYGFSILYERPSRYTTYATSDIHPRHYSSDAMTMDKWNENHINEFLVRYWLGDLKIDVYDNHVGGNLGDFWSEWLSYYKESYQNFEEGELVDYQGYYMKGKRANYSHEYINDVVEYLYSSGNYIIKLSTRDNTKVVDLSANTFKLLD